MTSAASFAFWKDFERVSTRDYIAGDNQFVFTIPMPCRFRVAPLHPPQ